MMENSFVISMKAHDDNSTGLNELLNVIAKEGVDINSNYVAPASSFTESESKFNISLITK